MNEVSYCITFPVFYYPHLQFPHVSPSRYWILPLGYIKLLSLLLHLPWWEWTVTFQSLWTGKGGSNGRVGVKMAHSTCVCVCACVSGCWQYVPCWDCTLQQPLNIQLPSISPSVIITDHQTHWLTQQLSRLYRCMYECVCVWICLFEFFF